MPTAATWFQQGEALVTNSAHDSAEFAQGLALLRKAAETGLVEAQLSMGHVHAQMHLLPEAAVTAAAWYRRAAEQGNPVAQNRLADLYMAGWGLPQDDAAALRLYRQTALRGYASAQCNLAYMLTEGIGTAVDETEATDLYLRAAAQGEARAYFNLGLRYLDGLGAAADPVQAWAWMENALHLDYPLSAAGLHLIEAALTPVRLAEARDLAKRIDRNFAQLQDKLRHDPRVLESAELYREMVTENFDCLGIESLSLDAGTRLGHAPERNPGPHPGRASATRVRLSERPHIFTVDEFVSRGESAHLMTLATMNLIPARELKSDLLSNENHAFNGSAATMHAPLSDAVVRNIERRVGRAFELPASHVEPLSVLRYQTGHRYAAHVDYFGPQRLEYNRRHGDVSGERSASFLAYLCAPKAGGETHYLKIGHKIAGRDRMALCHFNCLPSGEPDPMTLHTGEPVVSGEKWLARTTLREHPLY
jgi:TPR repeat protein